MLRTAHARCTIPGLEQVEEETFPVREPVVGDSLDALRREYFRDLSRAHSLETPEPELGSATGNTHMSMVRQLLTKVDVGEGFDYAAVAMSVPNSDPLQSMMSWLVDTLPGRATPLGVTDQGVVAAFTAIRLLSAYTSGERTTRALLVCLDRKYAPFQEDMRGEPVPTVDSAVAMVFDNSVAGELSVVARTGVGQGEVADRSLPDLLDTDSGLEHIVGHGLAEANPDRSPHVRTAREGAPCTGVWTEFAAWFASRSGRREAVVADYDRGRGYLSHCVYRPGGD